MLPVIDREYTEFIHIVDIKPYYIARYLHDNGFHSVYMIDPGVKVDDNYFVYKTGKEQNAFVCDIYRNEFSGIVPPGPSNTDGSFISFQMPSIPLAIKSL